VWSSVDRAGGLGGAARGLDCCGPRGVASNQRAQDLSWGAEVTRPSNRFHATPQRKVSWPVRIHIVGASGSGTTSLAAEIAARHGHQHLDTDDYFWLRTVPPYREKRPPEERVQLLREAFDKASSWVLSGSLCGWGDSLIPEFELVVFLIVPTPVRLTRLLMREKRRYGLDAITPGGSLHESHVEFLDWAGRYDTGGLEMRSRALHEAWLATVSCPVIRLEGDLSADEQLERIASNFSGPAKPPAAPGTSRTRGVIDS